MAELQDLFEHLFDSVSKLGELLYTRTSTNLDATFKNMTLKQWIRLVIIVGAYCLLRPYILKMAGKHQVKQLEKAEEEASKAEISPNQLRGQIDIPEDSDDDDEAAEGGAQAQASAARMKTLLQGASTPAVSAWRSGARVLRRSAERARGLAAQGVTRSGSCG